MNEAGSVKKTRTTAKIGTESETDAKHRMKSEMVSSRMLRCISIEKIELPIMMHTYEEDVSRADMS